VTATARHGLDPAPPELRLTQELLNTATRRQDDLLAECLLARALGTWPRLKLRRNERCPVAFYDCSRNGSRV